MANDNEIGVRVVVDPSGAAQGSDDAAKAVQDAANSINASLSKVTTASNSTAAAIRSGFSGIEDQLKVMQGTLLNVGAAASSMSSTVTSSLGQITPAASRAAAGLGGVGHAAAGVRREFLVLGHEIVTGNWTRFGGSLLVLGERMDLLRQLTGPVGVGLGLLVGVIAAFTVAAVKGAEDIEQLNKALELTGNRAGLTQDRYLEMSKTIAAANAQIGMGGARSAVEATAATGVFGPNSIQAISSAVAEISRASGETAEKVAQDFAKMDEGVAKWAASNKEAKDLITGADLEYVRTLEEQGQKEEAEVYLAQRISEKLGQLKSDLGYLPSLWNEVRNAASAAWDAMMNAGRPDTLSEQIDKLKATRDRLKDTSVIGGVAGAVDGGVSTLGNGGDLETVNKQIAALELMKKTQDSKADADAKAAANADDSKKGANALDEMSARYDKNAQKAKELAEAQTALNNALKGLPPAAQRSSEQIAYATKMQQEYDEAVAGINSKGPKAKKLSPGAAAAPERSEDNGELALLKDRLGFEQQELEKSYKANEIGLKDYYSQRIAITKEGIEAEIAVANKGVSNAENAAKLASGPNQQAEAQARIIQAKNRVALLNQQLNEQEQSLKEQMQEQQDLQDKKIQALQIEASTTKQLADVNRQATLGSAAVRLGQASNKQLENLQVQLENERYEISLDGLNKRMALENQTPVQIQQINNQIEQLEEEHQAKLLQLQVQSAEEQAKPQQQLVQSIEDDFAQFFESVTEGTKTLKNAFLTMATDIQKQLVQVLSKQLVNQLFGSGTGAGSGLNGLAGGLLGMAGNGVGGPTSGQNGGVNTANGGLWNSILGLIGQASSMGGGGGSSMMGGFSSLFGSSAGSAGSEAGAFGFSTGLEGTGDAVAAGAASDAGSEGMSALMGIAAYAKGTNYVPSTGLAMLHKGEAVVPAAYNNSGGSRNMSARIQNNFYMPKNYDLRTQSQVAYAAGGAIQTALRRNG